MLLTPYYHQFRSPLVETPPNCRGIVRSDLFCFSGLLLVSGCSFTKWYGISRYVGLLFSIYHSRFRSLFLAKAAELPWYCLLGCISLVFSIYRYRLRSLFIPTAAELSWYCAFRIWASSIHFTTTVPTCLFNRRPPNFRGIIRSGLFAIGRDPFYFLLNRPLQSCGIVKRTLLRSSPTFRHCFQRSAFRGGRRTVVLQYFYYDFSPVRVCFFYFSYPALRLDRYFLLPALFSA